MKLTQASDQIEIKTSGAGNVIGGIALTLLGLSGTVMLGGGLLKDTSGKAAPAWLAVFGLIFLAIGVLLIIKSSNRQVILRKNGTSAITSKKVIGGEVASQNFATSEIIAVRLQTYLNNSGDTRQNSSQRRSTLSLILNNNSVVQLADEAGPAGSFSFNGMDVSQLIQKAPLSKEARQIAEFLNVELQAYDGTDLATAIKTVVGAFQKQAGPAQPTAAAPAGTPPEPDSGPPQQPRP